MTTAYDAIDLFAGPGGWDVAARDLGLSVLGIEWDAAACETRRAAGLPTVESDVRKHGPSDFADVRTLIGSPPCQTFSVAGKGAGRAALDVVLQLAKRMAVRESITEDLATLDDERTGLVLEPLRWVLGAVDFGAPYETIVLEQVPTVLPVWEAFAEILRAEGYAVATGRLTAEQYGVPQTRKRAFLVARRSGPATLPEPTHRKYKKGVAQDEGDSTLLPWVSMAQALSWGMTARPAFTVAAGTASGGADTSCVGGSGARAQLYGERAAGRWLQRSNYSIGTLSPDGTRDRVYRELDEPSCTITGRPPTWSMVAGAQRHATVRRIEEPAPTIIGGHDFAGRVWRRDPPLTDQGPIRVLPEEAAALQSFPNGYPWRGTKTQTYQQIGNAVPPLFARAVLSAALDVS